jgi:hypothetical protein
MGTNYYRIITHEEVLQRKGKLLESILTMPLESSVIINDFCYIKKENEWSTVSPWDIFLQDTAVHLGKRSNGWKFCWNFNDNKYYKNKEELLAFIRSGRIVDEYGEEQNIEEFIEMAFNWYEPNGWIYDENYVIENYDKKGKPRPFTANPEYYDIIIDGLRVSKTTKFC